MKCPVCGYSWKTNFKLKMRLKFLRWVIKPPSEDYNQVLIDRLAEILSQAHVASKTITDWYAKEDDPKDAEDIIREVRYILQSIIGKK